MMASFAALNIEKESMFTGTVTVIDDSKAAHHHVIYALLLPLDLG